MIDSSIPASGTLPSARGQLLNQVCAAFDAAWRAGQRPRIEPFLEQTPEPLRSSLLHELLVRELTYRRRAGEEPVAEDYQVRFPDQAALIGTLFRAADDDPTGVETPSSAPPAPAAGAGTPSTLPLVPPGLSEPGWPTVPGYTILGAFPSSGMGVVYRARQENLNRVVALKMIRNGPLAGAQEFARFRIEAEAVARLHHPHVVQIFDFGELNGLPYFTMEFMTGGTLAQKLAGRPLPCREAAGLIETLARAMHYVHQQAIVHRDLKPANVLLAADGTPKIADFGLAKFLNEDRSLTFTGAVMGTASYMATEQAAGRTREVGPPADLYALGAILYETLTGQPPFKGETRELTIIQVLSEEPVPPARLRPEVPDELEAVCLKCLEKEPGQRYASALELADDLQRFLRGEPISVAAFDDWEWQARCARRAGYEVQDVLKCGLTGNVYKARHLRLNRVVALKMLPVRARAEPTVLERLRREAEAVARLHHPHIVQVYDFSEQNGQPYLTTEFVDGGNLAERSVDAPLPAREAARLLETLARATQYAHERGIIHCGLKPGNVLLTTDGVVKISSFGLARLVEKDSPAAEIGSGRRRLSRYMAPEQAEDRPGVIGPATDIYALGAILYQLLTGQAPFLGDTIQDLLDQVRRQPPLPPRRLESSVPADLEKICLKCLEKEPARRYASALDLADDLRRFQAGEPLQKPPRPVRKEKSETPPAIPDYEILGRVGYGQMGVVYKARQLSGNRFVALKVFHDEILEDLERLIRFCRGALTMARLLHPNIVQLYDILPICDLDETDSRLFFAMEFVDGISLPQKLGGAPLPVGPAVQLVETLARALDFAHGCGQVHGDLKPANVLLTADDTPKISNFGLARRLRQEADDHILQLDQVLGTPSYLAPEQVEGQARNPGPAVDIYAVGAILYEVLTGRPPFAAHLREMAVIKVLSEKPVPPSQLQPDVPEELGAVCLKCLEKEPGRRFASARELAESLQRFLPKATVETGLLGGWRRLIDWFKRRRQKPRSP